MTPNTPTFPGSMPPPAPASPPDTSGVGQDAQPKASRPADDRLGSIVSHEDYDYVTETTTVRHGVVLEQLEVDGADGDKVPSLTVGLFAKVVTLPADAFEA